MKKILALIFIFCAGLGFTACESETEATETATVATETATEASETATEATESTLERFSYFGESYDAINQYVINLRDENGDFMAEIQPNSELHVYGLYCENTDRAVVEWQDKIGTVLVGGLVKKESTETEEPTQETTSESEETSDGIFINKTSQKISLIINGELICEGDCVTGTKGGIYDTPTGVFDIDARITNTTLTDGETYWADVDYWLPFEGDIGIHDASWRESFGGDIYEVDGSHGCVNVPLDVAEQIYENSYIGLKVYVEE